jgi:hypothetical protein
MTLELLLSQYPLKFGADSGKYWRELLKRYKGIKGDVKDIRTPVFDLLSEAGYYRSESGLIEYCIDRIDEIRAKKKVSEVSIEEALAKKKGERSKLYRVLIVSDVHGVFMDLNVIACLFRVLKGNHFDEIILNGDILDFPLISKHSSKIRLNQLEATRNYTEVGEIEFTIENFLKPLRAVAPQSRIVFRLGNHSERVTNPLAISKEQIVRLQVLQNHYNTIKLDEMLRLSDLNIEYDPSPVRNMFGVFNVVHGLALSSNASELNIREFSSSGSSGHSHRLSTFYKKNRDRNDVWLESGCLRIADNIEYIATAKSVNWANGFVDVLFDLNDTSTPFFGKTTHIFKGKCCFNGYMY